MLFKLVSVRPTATHNLAYMAHYDAMLVRARTINSDTCHAIYLTDLFSLPQSWLSFRPFVMTCCCGAHVASMLSVYLSGPCAKPAATSQV